MKTSAEPENDVQVRLPAVRHGHLVIGGAAFLLLTAGIFWYQFHRIEAAMIGPLPGDVVIDAGEVAQIRSAIAEYNAFIPAQAEAKGAALVDIHVLFDSIKAKGLVSGGQRLTTGFLGGLFSLDGVHPTNTGYAVVANEFIEALNTHFAAGIPPAAVSQVRKTDPLVFPGVGHPASALGHVSPEAAASLRSALRH